MKARSKFLIGGVLILGTATWLMAASTRDTATYYLEPAELAAKVSEDPSFYNRGLKLGARVVDGTIQRDSGGRHVSFQITDGTQTYDVVYKGVAPDTFTDGVDVVVEGRLYTDGTFHATTLLAKCASRYENVPEKYRDAPGYQSQQTPRA